MADERDDNFFIRWDSVAAARVGSCSFNTWLNEADAPPPEDLGVVGLHPVEWVAPMEDSSRTSNPAQVTSQELRSPFTLIRLSIFLWFPAISQTTLHFLYNSSLSWVLLHL